MESVSGRNTVWALKLLLTLNRNVSEFIWKHYILYIWWQLSCSNDRTFRRGGPLCLLYICISVPFHAEVSHTHTHTSFYFFTSVSLTFTHVLQLLLCFLFLFKLSVYILMYVYFTVCLKTADDETRCWTSVMSEIWCFRLTRWDWTVLLIKLTSSPVCMSADEWKHSWWIRS